MIIARLVGGLGNQLFQYAVARRLAHVLQAPLKLDRTYYETRRLRSYHLHAFNIEESFASREQLSEILGPSGKGLVRIAFRLRKSWKPGSRWTVIREGHIGPLDPRVMNASGNVYLDGYWQTEKYFADVQDIIRREFTVKYEQDPQSQEIVRLIESTRSVSVHIRRGDYVSDARTSRVHGSCPLGFYQECVRRIVERVALPRFFVFSDDPRWAVENLRLEWPTTYVTHNDASKAYEDLRLMSSCKHNIIANSSFSWWAAWLNPNPGKIVFAPRKWLNDPTYDTRDLVPRTWIRV
jgi:hypothetical protein